MKTHRVVVVPLLIMALWVGFAATSMAQPGTDCVIKGIISSSGQKMYLLPGHYLYEKVTPDLDKGERWFCEAAGAERAGFLFVPDPTNRDLRPPDATPTPPPTPEPPPAETTEAVDTDAAAPSSESEAAAPPTPTPTPTPEPPTPTPEPEVFLDAQGGDLTFEEMPFGDMPSGSPEAMMQAYLPLILAWMWVVIGASVLMGIMVIVVRWKLLVKAGEPGWPAIIPIYSDVMMLKIAGLAWWWIILAFIPIANLAFAIVWIFLRPFKTAENFGKGFLYGLGLLFFPLSPFFWLHLAFSNAEYIGG